MIAEATNPLSEIMEKSLLEIVPGLAEISQLRGTVRLIHAGATVARAGSPISFVIIPFSSDFILMSPTNNQPIGRLKRRQSLALGDLLDGRPYPYSAIAETQTKALFLPVEDLRKTLAHHPEVEHYLRLVTAVAAVRNFTLFLGERGVDKPDLFRICSAISREPVDLREGTDAGAFAGKLCFIESGTIRISRTTGSPRELSQGAWFGGQALVAPFMVDYKIEVIEAARIRTVSLREIRSTLERLGLTEAICGEPWIGQAPIGRVSRVGRITPLPGEPVLLKQARALGIALNQDEMKLVQDDADSFPSAIFGVCMLLKSRVNLSNIEVGMGMHSTMSFARIAALLEPMGFHTEPRRVKAKQLETQNLPALAAVGPRLMVIVRAERRSIIVLDPARGLVRIRDVELAPLWDGTLLGVTVANDVRTDAESESRVGKRSRDSGGTTPSSTMDGAARPANSHEAGAVRRLIREQIFAHKRLILSMAGLNLLAVALQAVSPLFSQHILNEVLTTRDTETLKTCVVGLVIVAFFLTLTQSLGDYISTEFSIRFDRRLGSTFYRHVLALPASEFEEEKTGKVLNMIQSIEAIRVFLAGPSLPGLLRLLSLPIYLGILAFYSPWISAIAIVVLICGATVQLNLRHYFNSGCEQIFDADVRSKALLSEQIGAIGAVKANRCEKQMLARWEEPYLRFVRLGLERRVRGLGAQGIMNFLSITAQTGALWLCAYLALHRELSPGAILAVSLYLRQVMMPLSGLASVVMDVAQVEVSVRKLAELLKKAPEETAARANRTHFLELQGKIKLDDVSFRYSKEAPWALKDVSLTIYPRQIVAIVGRSGCGKSTLASLISGNAKPVSGRIFFDDFDLSFLSPSALRRQIGFILQGSDLVGDSLLGNIAFDDDVPQRKIAAAAAANSGAHDFISKLPDQYDYRLAEGGIGLSGGEKQRVCIARTLYRQPKILIMDEATSALDAGSERQLVSNMREIFAGKTAIIIAHRLSTIRNADRIIVMDAGQVVEDGTHRELLERKGHYFKLFRNQIFSSEL